VRIALGADAGGTAGGTAGTEELSARGFDVRLVVDQALAAREALVCVCVCVCVCECVWIRGVSQGQTGSLCLPGSLCLHAPFSTHTYPRVCLPLCLPAPAHAALMQR
jgi:hypothetical protein